MSRATFRIQEAASHRIDEIYRHTHERWGAEQAFAGIASYHAPSRPIPAAFGVDGSVFRYERQFVYWRKLGNGDIGIVTVLHERMHQSDRFRDDFGL